MKKLLSIILVGLMVLSLAACGGDAPKGETPKGETPKGEKLNMTVKASGQGEGAVYSADIYYEPAETVEVSSSYATKQEIKDKEQNIDLKFMLHGDSTYANNKKSDSTKEGYKEFKVGDFDAYAYHYNDSRYMVYVFLDGSTEASQQARFLEIVVSPYEKMAGTTGEMVFEMEYVQNIINSITYNGLILPGAEAEAK